MNNNKLFSICIALFIPLFANAQKSYSEIDFGFKAHYGIIWAHTPKNLILVKGHFPIFEASIIGKTSGSKEWHQLFNKPQVGVSIMYSNLANKEILGYTSGAFPWINFNLLNNSKAYKLYLKIGAGIGYVNRTFNIETNYKNIAISSHFNALINFQIENQVQICPNLAGSFSISLYHLSNGSSKLPNLGINIPTINLGLNYRIAKREVTTNPINTDFKKNYTVVSTICGGIKQAHSTLDPTFLLFNSSTTLERHFTKKNAFTLGLDLIVDRSKTVEQRFAPEENQRVFNSGITIGHLLKVGKLDIVTQWGTYTSSRAMEKKAFHRIGLRYYISDHILVCTALNTHWGKADHIEWGIGYKF